MLELLRLLVIIGGLIVITFLVLLALPQCKLREMLMPFVAWGFVALCAAYVISPVDILPEIVLGPFGLVDDFVARSAGRRDGDCDDQRRKKKKSGRIDPELN